MVPAPGGATIARVFVTQRNPPGEEKGCSGIPLPSTNALPLLMRRLPACQY